MKNIISTTMNYINNNKDNKIKGKKHNNKKEE